MKKFFLAVAALAMLATSCTKDETTVAGGESLVSFSVSSPELQTRYGEGSNATELYYAFYEVNNGTLTLLSEISATGDDETGKLKIETLISGKATINVPLVDGRHYAAIFWAQAPKAPYTIDWASQTMSYKDVALTANNEDYDAFYAYYPVSTEKTHKVTLTRPFAQINIATADITAAENAGFVATQTKVVVKGVCTSFDLVNGKVAADEKATLTFDWEDKADGKAKTSYDMLAMNYVLVEGRRLVDVTMYVNDEDVERNYTTVPVERNYQTFILGKLLTTQNDFNVEVEEDFNEKLIIDIQKGGEFTLTEDIVLAAPLTLDNNVEATINLNGHNITYTNPDEDAYTAVFMVKKGVLTIEGEGNVVANGVGNIAVWAGRGDAANDGKVIIKGGNFSNNSSQELIYTNNKGVIEIYGGTFSVAEEDQKSFAAPQYAVLNLYGNGKTGNDIIVYGGTFHKFNPADNISENPKKNFCAEGYTAVQNGDYYTVKLDGAVVSTAAELTAALADAKVSNIFLADGNFGTIVMKSNKNIIAKSAGAKVDCVNLNGAENVTLKGITFDAATAVMSYGGNNAERYLALIISRDASNSKTVNGAKNLVIDGCNFIGTFPGEGGCVTSFADQNHTGSHNVTIKNCTFDVANCGYAIYGYYTGDNSGNFVIEGNTFKSATYGNTIYLGRYMSSKPVVVTGNTFESVTSLQRAIYVQDHSNYGVSVNASNNTFAN